MSRAHAHNDYLQERPLYDAIEMSFGSIEVDLVLDKDEIYVAHEKKTIHPLHTFVKHYWLPLITLAKDSNFVYNEAEPLRLLLDLKGNGKKLLRRLVAQLEPYPEELKSIKIIISGDMPCPKDFNSYPQWIWFDGRQDCKYNDEQWQRIAMMSEKLADIIKNKKVEILAEKEIEKLEAFTEKYHNKGKLVRLWGAPDSEAIYDQLDKAGVDIIGSDDYPLLIHYFNEKK